VLLTPTSIALSKSHLGAFVALTRVCVVGALGSSAVLRQIVRLLVQPAKRVNLSIHQILPGVVGDGRLQRTIDVRVGESPLFQIYDFGTISRARAKSFEAKEPETLRWINQFPAGSRILDVGANVGLFSLYAAIGGSEVVAVEPDALNFALLNLNIRLNEAIVSDRIRAFCVALHSEMKMSTLNVTSGEWGAALSSFDNDIDFGGRTFTPRYRQGSIGLRLDDFLSGTAFRPTHLKIDVDGNEGEVLAGGAATIRDTELSSILIELDERRPDYSSCISTIMAAGFKLIEKAQSEIFSVGDFSRSYNHIFVRAA
jgi:FkbM family methyltransferase